MNLRFLTLALGCVLAASPILRADLATDTGKAARALQTVMPEAEKMVADGRVDEADQKILATFPEVSRTAVEALLLGNILFKQDMKMSYALHQRAAKELPDEPSVQLEWAMEQHRAGEYAGAADSYAKFSKANPGNAPVMGLCAECLIRVGKTKEAVDMWRASENAPDGTLEELESYVCEVHSHKTLDHDRQILLQKMRAGDVDAARQLVNLDCHFERDWWNTGPRKSYLKKDIDLIQAVKWADAKQLDEITCAAQCGIILDSASDPTNVLQKAGYLLNADATLPHDGGALSTMLAAALAANAITEKDGAAKWASAVFDLAKKGHDAEMFNVAAHLNLGTANLAAIDQLGWETTGEERFAASLLVGEMAKGTLKLDDPRLAKAVKQFPQNAILAGIIARLTPNGTKAKQDALVQAIEAEYSHFSVNQNPLWSQRPSANELRAYFKALAVELGIK